MMGYTIMEQEKLDELATRGDTKEGYQLRVEDSEELRKMGAVDITDHKNRWPDPKLLPNLKPVTMDYIHQQWALAFNIIHMIAEQLRLPRDYFDGKFKDPFVSLRPLHYSSELSQPDKRIWGCGAHTDYGFITLLTSDENDGLQIFDEEQDDWFDVKPIPGTIVVFIGDMLKGITSGYLRSAIHRVVNEKGVDRYSCALFFDPDMDASCEQIPTLN